MNAAVNGAWESGVFVVLSAGNNNAAACGYSPPNATRGFTVAAMTINDTRASFSNYGDCVQMFAPGENVATARAASLGGGYAAVSGTSFAAPFVAGAGAALLHRFPNDTPDQIANSILDGHGRPVLNGQSGDGNYQLYSVLPVPVYVQQVVGPSTVRAGAVCQWSSWVRGGRGPFTYSWWGLISGSGQTITSYDGQITSSTDINVGVWDSLGGYAAQGLWVNVVPNDPPMEQCEP